MNRDESINALNPPTKISSFRGSSYPNESFYFPANEIILRCNREIWRIWSVATSKWKIISITEGRYPTKFDPFTTSMSNGFADTPR